MDDPVLLQIEWAEQHIGRLYSALDRFIATKPYLINVKIDAQTKQPLYCLASVDDTPTEILLTTGDALQALRTALDYLACALVRANNHPIGSLTGFPIFSGAPTSPNDQSRFRGKVKGMRQEWIDIINDIKPYKGGDAILWRLHELNRRHKHRLLLTAGTVLSFFNAGSHERFTLKSRLEQWGADPALYDVTLAALAKDNWITLRNTPFPLKAGSILLRDFAGAEVNKDIDFRFQVAFNEPGVCEGEPIASTLRLCMNHVKRTVNRFSGYNIVK